MLQPPPCHSSRSLCTASGKEKRSKQRRALAATRTASGVVSWLGLEMSLAHGTTFFMLVPMMMDVTATGPTASCRLVPTSA